MGRFQITHDAGALLLTTRGTDVHAVARWVRWGLLAVLAVGPALFALLGPGSDAPAVIALLLAGTCGAIADTVYTGRFRVFEHGVWFRVRRTLEIRPAAEGDHRHAPHGPTVVVDGTPLDPADPPRVGLSTSVIVMRQNGFTNTRIRHHVNLVFRARVLRVDTLAEVDEAGALVDSLSKALGLDASEVKLDLEVPFEATLAGMVIGGVAVLAQLVPVIGAMPWAMAADVDGGMEGPLALAGVVIAALVVLVQETAFRFAVVAVADATRETYGIAPTAPPTRRAAWIGVAACGAVALPVLVLALRSGPDPAAWGSFSLGGDRLAMVEIDGARFPLGLVYSGAGKALVTIDPGTGKHRWSLSVPASASDVSLGGPFALVSGSGGTPTTASAQVFDPRTGAPRGSGWASGDLKAAFFKDGCLVLRVGEFLGPSKYRAFDATTGTPCTALPSIDAPEPARAPERPPTGSDLHEYAEWLRKQSQASDKDDAVASLLAAEKEQTPRARDASALRASVTAGGVVYKLDATGDQLVVSASRDGAETWKTTLPATSLRYLPFAAGDGLVLVAGAGPRRGKQSPRLRLVGLDAATGKIRFVERHPAAEGGSTDVAVSGGTALLYWASELRGYDAMTGKLRWSTAPR